MSEKQSNVLKQRLKVSLLLCVVLFLMKLKRVSVRIYVIRRGSVMIHLLLGEFKNKIRVILKFNSTKVNMTYIKMSTTRTSYCPNTKCFY